MPSEVKSLHLRSTLKRADEKLNRTPMLNVFSPRWCRRILPTIGAQVIAGGLGWALILGVLAPRLAGEDTVPAAIPQHPDGFWPLPMVPWLGDGGVPSAVRITEVNEGFPGDHLGLTNEDLPLRVGAAHVLSLQDFMLARYLAVQRGDDRIAFLRKGAVEEHRLASFSAWGRWGVDLEDLEQVPPSDLPKHLIPAWQALPMRVRLQAEKFRSGSPAPWWLALVTLRQDVGNGGELPTALPEMPDPYLQRVAAWWLEAGRSKGQLTPCEDAEEALFRAAHFPWPILEPAEVGNLSMTDPQAQRVLRARASGNRNDHKQSQRAANRIVDQPVEGYSYDTGRYLSQCVAALLDDQRHGGWPYRSSAVWTPENRAKVLAELATVHNPALADVVAVGRIGPAVMDSNGPMLMDTLTTLHRSSPWLAREALNIAIHGAQFHQKSDWLSKVVIASDAPVITPAMRMAFRWMAVMPDQTMNPMTGPSEPQSLLAITWRHFGTWDRQIRQGQSISTRLNNLAWGMATDPTGFDPEYVERAGRQLVLSMSFGMEGWQVDTVAACAARVGKWEDALAWQRAAVVLSSWGNRPAEEAERMRTTFLAHQQEIHQRRPITKGPAVTLVPSQMAGAEGTWSGMLAEGRRAGVWTRQLATGTVVEELGWRGGEPGGRWVGRSTAGHLRWEGYVFQGARLGWWRLAGKDGDWFTGWYDGNASGQRCGFWRWYGADGALRGEGPCLEGRAVSPWKVREPSGVWVTADPASIPLPTEPAVPSFKAKSADEAAARF